MTDRHVREDGMDDEDTAGAPGRDRSRTIDVVRAMARSAPEPLHDEHRLVADLGYDSLRLIELAIAIEKHLVLPTVELEDAVTVSTVGDVVTLVSRARAQEAA